MISDQLLSSVYRCQFAIADNLSHINLYYLLRILLYYLHKNVFCLYIIDINLLITTNWSSKIF